MNNKGQTLVIFVIILPIILFVLALVIDLGLFSVEKRKVDNNTKDVLKYYIDNIDEENIDTKVNNLLNSNLSDIKINLDKENMKLTVEKEYDGIFDILYDSKISITYTYKNNKIIKG